MSSQPLAATAPLLPALAHALIGISVGLAIVLMALSVGAVFPASRASYHPPVCPCQVEHSPVVNAATSSNHLPLTGSVS